MAPLKLIAVGNPGAGKSSFGNRLLGKVVFEAKASITGGGVTTKLEESSSDKYRYIDIPGLADPQPELRKEAAEVLAKGLREDVDTKILFFVRTHEGRILAEDKVTMTLVCEALGSNLQENKYGVLVNGIPEEAFEALKDVETCSRWHLTLWAGMLLNGKPVPRTNTVLFIAHDPEMKGTNKLKPLPAGILKRLEEIPAFKMKSKEVKVPDTQHFDAHVQRQVEVDKKDSWNDVAKELVKHAVKRTMDTAFDGAEFFVNPAKKIKDIACAFTGR